jgi:hypothetical protein
MMSSDRGVHWFPVAHGLTTTTASVSLTGVVAGTYLVKVLSSDGINLGTAMASVSL